MTFDFGLTPDDFSERYFEKEPRLQKAAVRGETFGWSDLDGVLHQIEPVAPVLQLFNGGMVVEEQFTDLVSELGGARRRLNKRRFFDQLRSGATLVINRVETFSARALRLCNAVASLAGAQTTGNAYLSVGGRGTFGKHWDTHDVFAIQLVGRKRWQVFAPTFPLPLSMHRSEDSRELCPATPVLDCVLEAGDVLYVPRGWWHHVIPFDEPSLHLSVGTYPPTVHDYLSWVCARLLPAALGARQSLTASLDRTVLDSALQVLREAALSDASRVEFERGVTGGERPRSELDTALFLSEGADGLIGGAMVRLGSRQPVESARGEIVVSGGRLRLHPLSQSIITAVGEGALTVDELCARLAAERPDAIRAALIDLAQYEIVAIERLGGRSTAI